MLQSTDLILDSCSRQSVSCDVREGHCKSASSCQVFGVIECSALPAFSSSEEIVMTAYRRWGTELTKHLQGIYHFAIWDEEKHSLYAAVSPTAEVGLHYWQQGCHFCLANFMPVLKKMIGQPLKLNEHKLAEMLVLQHHSSENSFYEGIKRLPAGYQLIYTNGQLTIERYWSALAFDSTEQYRDRNEAIDDFRSCFFQAVHRYLDPSNSTACELSGGLDSSAVTAVAAEQLHHRGQRLNAFGMAPEKLFPFPKRKGWNFDDRQLMKAITHFSGHIDLTLIHENDYLFNMPSMAEFCLKYSDGPVRNPLNIPWMAGIYRAAGEAGYQHVLNGHRGNMTVSQSGENRSVYGRLRKLAGKGKRALFDRTDTAHWWHDYCLISDEAIAKYQPNPPCFAFQPTVFSAAEGFREVLTGSDECSGLFQAFHYLYGVKPFDPTADLQVVEKALRMPNFVHFHKGQSRSLIRDAMKGLWPDLVRLNNRRGEQNGMWFFQLRALAPHYLALLPKFREHDLIRGLINLNEMERLLQNIQTMDPMKFSALELIKTYRMKLARACHVAEWVYLHAT